MLNTAKIAKLPYLQVFQDCEICKIWSAPIILVEQWINAQTQNFSKIAIWGCSLNVFVFVFLL